MTASERRIAIKQIKAANKDVYGPEKRNYTWKQIISGILAGGGLAAYIALKATEPIENIKALPINGYVQESSHWINEVFIPKLRNFPELWEAIKGNNWLEHFTAGITGLLAGASIWQGYKKAQVKREERAANKEAIKDLGR